jgi:hypothetical protein
MIPQAAVPGKFEQTQIPSIPVNDTDVPLTGGDLADGN